MQIDIMILSELSSELSEKMHTISTLQCDMEWKNIYTIYIYYIYKLELKQISSEILEYISNIYIYTIRSTLLYTIYY